jgi:aryl-alcohol dehydrogenase-like predicted oxidoreductase
VDGNNAPEPGICGCLATPGAACIADLDCGRGNRGIRSREDLAGTAREQMAGGYFTDEGLAVVTALDEIATARGAEIATVALAWLQVKPTVVAPIASARVVGQLGALMAAAELDLTTEEVGVLDTVSALVETPVAVTQA